MPTNVSIIEIDLGEIDKIISEDVAELSGDAREKLDQAIQERKIVEKIRIEREQRKEQAATELNNVLTEAYDRLVSAGLNGVPVEKLLADVQSLITTPSAFTLRMKSLLKEKDNPYIIKRKTIKKIPHYFFEPFNEQTTENPE